MRVYLKIYEAKLNDELLEQLIGMSADWEGENSCHGYRKNERSDIEPNQIFLAVQEDEILGYLFGHAQQAERTNSVMAEKTPFFEMEELYTVPSHRSEGIGKALFRYAEQKAKAAGMEFVMLVTATKNYKSILHFYIDELGMDFWSASLFKRL